MNKKIAFLCLLVLAVAEMGFLFWMRHNFTYTRDSGSIYNVPVSVDFSTNFYEKNYISLNIPVNKAQWQGIDEPRKGEAIYVSVGKDNTDMLYVKWAQLYQPEGDYILTRAEGIQDGIVYFQIPADRLYMTSDQLKRISVSELAERIRVKNPETGQMETRMKNQITAQVSVKDGQMVITDLLVNGSPVEKSYTTVGVNRKVIYAVSGSSTDVVNGVPQKRQ